MRMYPKSRQKLKEAKKAPFKKISMFGQGNGFDATGGGQWQPPQVPMMDDAGNQDLDDGDNSHRPPNAFILYSQAMRSEVRQENPSLSNTEVSRLLGKMWKEVPNDVKLQYKQRAAKMQEEFKKQHPDYTYRKARRKRALNELLTKSTQGFPGPMPYAPDQFMYGYMPTGALPGMQGMQGLQGLPGMPGMQGLQGIPQQNQSQQMNNIPFAGFQSAQQGIPPMGNMQQMNGMQQNGSSNGNQSSMFSMQNGFQDQKNQ